MASEVKKEIELEIAHVLFIDIVGYSKLLIDEQRDYLHTLNEVVRETASFRAAEAAGKLTRLPTGDGMALVFATTPDAPVSCALQVSKALRSHPELRVRMGIHSGPVSGITDVNDRSNVAGAGINLAQRVMDCGDAGHILLSKHVADDLEQYRQWRSNLHDLGECEVKHDVRVHVVNLYTDELGNPETPEKFQQAKETQTAPAIPVSQAKPPRRSWTLIAAFIIAAGLIAAAGAAAMWFLTVHRHEEKANGTRQALAVEQPKEPTPHDIGAQKLTKVTVKKYGVSVLLPSDVFPDFEILSTGQVFSLTHDRASLTFYDSDKSLRQTFEDHVAGAAAEVSQNIDYKVLKDTWFVVSGTFGPPGHRAGFYTKGVKKAKNVIMMRLHYSEENYPFADDALTAISRSFDGN
jgi:class 3 adenylate cyclase